MDTQIVLRTDNDFTLQMKIPYSKTTLEFEEMIQSKRRELEMVVADETLKQFSKKFGKYYRVSTDSKKFDLFI
jgi:hypothetical protein